jgi:hypothetical protein
MLNLLPQYDGDSRPEAYAEAVSRLASVRHALRLVDGGLAAGPEGDHDAEIASAWPDAGEGRQRCFERRSARLVGAAATGIEALLAQRHDGSEPHAAASDTLVEEIRRELREVAGIILR